MGIYGTNSCNKNDKIYSILYIFSIIVLIIIGSLYEFDIISKNKEYMEKSVWWYGAIGLLITAFLLPVMNWILKNKSELTKTHYWYFSHILCYFVVTFVSPGQWPFWLAIGITWELFECYSSTSCNLIKKGYPITCSGMYDIIANIAGIAIAIWIRSEIPIEGLLKNN